MQIREALQAADASGKDLEEILTAIEGLGYNENCPADKNYRLYDFDGKLRNVLNDRLRYYITLSQRQEGAAPLESGDGNETRTPPPKRLKSGHTSQPTHQETMSKVWRFVQTNKHAAAFHSPQHTYRGLTPLFLRTSSLAYLLEHQCDIPPAESQSAARSLREQLLQAVKIDSDPLIPKPPKTRTKVPERLFAVERAAQLRHYKENILDWEDLKGTVDANFGRNIHFSAHLHGQGKTCFGQLAADPSRSDLASLRSSYCASRVRTECFNKHVHKLLAVVNLEITMADLPTTSAPGGAKLARMLWKGFCNVMQEMQMPLDSSLEFEDAADVIGTACSELGVSVGAVGFQIHIDGAEALADHPKTFDVATSLSISPPKADLNSEAKLLRERDHGELKAVYGVWRTLRPALALPGVWLLLTGASHVPHLLGKKYMRGLHHVSGGEAFPITLSALSPHGIAQVLTSTCSYTHAEANGNSLAEELGFIKATTEGPLELERKCGAAHCEADAPQCSHCGSPADRLPETSASAPGQLGQSVHPLPSAPATTGPAQQQMRWASSAPQPTPTSADANRARFAQFIQLLHWLTCGIPLLIREALRAAVQQEDRSRGGQGASWASLCSEAMLRRFTAEDSCIILHLKAGKPRMDCFVWDRLDEAEQRRMLLQILLGVPIHLNSVNDLSSALVRASVYTDCAQADREFQSPTKESHERMRREPVLVQPIMPPYMLPKVEESMGRPGLILCRAMREVPEMVGAGAAAEMAVRVECLESILMAMSANSPMSRVFPWLKDSPNGEVFWKSVNHRLIPGAKVQQTSVLNATSQAAIEADPWRRLLPPAEIGLQVSIMEDACCGIPHPNSAGPDLLFMGGNPPNKVIVAFQIKYRTTSDIHAANLQQELDRTADHAARWKEIYHGAASYLVYLIIGPRSQSISPLQGKLHEPSAQKLESGALAIPQGLGFLLLSEDQVADLIGRELSDAFSRLAGHQQASRQSDEAANLLNALCPPIKAAT